MADRTTFIVNPAACSGRGGRRWAALEPRVRAAFPDADVRLTEARGHATRLVAEVLAAAPRPVAEALAAAPRLVVAVGGDGTVHEVASGLLSLDPDVREGVRFGVLQNGTGNDFVRGAGIPQDVDAALALLRSGAERRFDAGRVRCAPLTGTDQVERWFLNAADFGIGAEVVRAVESGPRWLGAKPGYLWQTVRKLLTWRNPEVELRLDDGPLERHRIKTVALCNQPFFGGGMCVAPAARPDDGILSCTVFGDLGRLEAVRRLGETYQGREVIHPRIAYRTCRSLSATVPSGSGRRILLETDGELAGMLPAHFEIVPSALRVGAPPA